MKREHCWRVTWASLLVWLVKDSIQGGPLEKPQVRESCSPGTPSLLSQSRDFSFQNQGGEWGSHPTQQMLYSEGWVLRELIRGNLELGPKGGFPGALLGRKHIRQSRESADAETQGQCWQKRLLGVSWLAVTFLDLGRFNNAVFTLPCPLKQKEFFKHVVLVYTAGLIEAQSLYEWGFIEDLTLN